MNKLEKITKIQNSINRFYKNNDLSKDVEKFLYEIFNTVESMREEDYLINLLDWKENVIYKIGNDKYKIVNNLLYMENRYSQTWDSVKINPCNYRSLVDMLMGAEEDNE